MDGGRKKGGKKERERKTELAHISACVTGRAKKKKKSVNLIACAAEAPRDFFFLSSARSLPMACLDAARTLSNARATTSGSRSSGGNAVVRAPPARQRLARHRLAPPLLSLLPRAVPPNDSNGVSSDASLISAAAAAAAAVPTLDASAAAAIAAATGGAAMAMDSFAATAAPVLQRDSEFLFFRGGRSLVSAFLCGVGRHTAFS